MKKILIAGYYGFGNLGDEAILAALALALPRHIPGCRITVVSGDAQRTQRQHPSLSAVDGRDLSGLIDRAQQADLIVLGGGGLFQDYWEVEPASQLTLDSSGLAFYGSIPLLAHLVGVPCQVLGIGVGPLRTEAGRRATASALRLARAVSVRDQASMDLLTSLSLDSGPTIELAADPSLLLEPTPQTDVDEYLRTLGVDPAGNLVAVNLRYWDFDVDPQAWPQEIGRALDVLTAAGSAHLLLLPFQVEGISPYENDLEVLRQAQAAMAHPERTSLLTEVPPPQLMLGVIGRCRAAMVMRLHAAVFAVRQGLPTLALSYDPKVALWMTDMGQAAHTLPPDRWTSEALAEAWRKLPDRASLAPTALLKTSLTRLERTLDRARSLIGSALPPVSGEEQALRAFALTKVRQLAETWQALQASRAEVEGLETTQAALQTDLDSRVTQVSDLAREVAATRQSLAEQGERVQLAENQLGRITAELAERSEELARTRSASERLERRVGRREGQLLAQLNAHQRERDQWMSQLEAAHTRLAEIESGFSWRLVRRLRRLRLWLVPHGGHRERLIRRSLSAARRWMGRLTSQPSQAALPVAGPSLFPEWWQTADDRQEHLLRLEIFLDRELPRSQGQLVVIFSAVPLVLSEGQRATGLAKAFAQLGVPVVFAAWRWFPRPLPSDFGDDELLLQIPLDVFITRAEELLQQPASRPMQGTFLIEFPHPSLFRVLNLAGAYGWTTIYDVIDDWEAFHQVGQAIWYDPKFESHLLHNVDHILATTQALADKMVGLGASRVHLQGNAYEGESFAPSVTRKDLPRGEITIGYFGHLSRSWFDWGAVHRLAASHPRWSFHIIGYGDGPEAPPPDNVLLLGKVPHGQLPEYAANWDVGLIPFRPGNVSRAVDPVKIYEYLALGLPVVTQGMPHLEAIPGVRNAESAEAMAVLIEQAAKTAIGGEAVREFLSRNTWPQRARAILDLREQPSLNPLWHAPPHLASHG